MRRSSIKGVMFVIPLFFLSISCAFALSEECILAREMANKALKLFKENQKRGLSAFMKAQSLCPQDEALTYNLGLAYYLYGSRKKACETWQKLYQKGARKRKLLANLAWVLLELKRTDKAVEIAREGLERFPEESAFLDTLVKAYWLKKKYEEAYRLTLNFQNKVADKLRQKTAQLLADEVWRKYYSGWEKDALKSARRLVRLYPEETLFKKTYDQMEEVFLGDAPPPPPPDSEPQISLGDYSLKPKSKVAEGDSIDFLLQKISPLPVQNKAYALIVGISDYQQIEDLHFAERDALNVYKVLVTLGFVPNDTEHVKLLLNQEATRAGILQGLKWLEMKAKLNPESRIFFYFSGHGAPILEGGQVIGGLLLPADAILEDLEGTGIKLSKLKLRLASLPNKNVVAVVDACFTGQGRSVSLAKPAMLLVREDFLKASKPIIVSAVKKPAQEFPMVRQGAFTYFFLRGLLGEADGINGKKDGVVDALEAYLYAKKKLLEFNFDQDPMMSPEYPVPLVRVPSLKVKAKKGGAK